jgi:hypothetical protein
LSGRISPPWYEQAPDRPPECEPHAEQLWNLVHAGYQANWFCYLASHATEHAAELDRQLLQRLLALPGDLWLDVSGEDVDDD